MRIWLVEKWNEEKELWEPTKGVWLSRRDGRSEKSSWEEDNPNDRFRLSEYRSTRKEKA